MRSTVAKFTLFALFLGGFAWAQDQQDPNEDQPGPGVARVSLINGEVSVRRGDSGDLVAAVVNAPLMAGDHVVTGPSGRAEVQFDYGNMLRIGPQSDVRLADIQNQLCQVQVASGTVMFRALRPTAMHAEIDTPSVSVRPTTQGAYRISVDPDGQSVITVRSGDADIASARGSQPLHAGQTMNARGDASDPEFQIASAAGRDEWDAWNEDRDHRLERSKSYQYVNRDINGADDLDSYGRWVSSPEYGPVWAPTVPADWAPYRDGRWVWEDYYGWTWVDYAPWGWAPYHYGRWFRGSYGWCWYPGGRSQFWRPALVGFFGFGSGIGVGFGFGNIGWVPLAPFEVFHPWYGGRGFGRGYGYGHNVTIVNNVNLANTYRNARVVNGVSGVPVNQFGHGQVGRITPVSSAMLRQGSALRGGVPVAPTANSLRFSDRAAGTTGLPRTVGQQTRFAMQHRPAATNRVSFQEQQRGMQQMVQRTFANGAGRSGAAVGTQSAPAANRGQTSSWRQPGQSGATSPAAGRSTQNSQAVQSNAGGWRRFGGSGTRSSSPAGAPSRTTSPAPSNSRDYRGFGNTPSQSASPGYSRGSAGASPRYETPRSTPQGQIHLNPPIVRERSAPSYHGGSSSSAPQYHSGGGSSGGSSHSSSGGHSSSSSSSSSHGSSRR